MICEDGFTKRKIVMHAGNEFKFQELSDFNEVKCKAAYKNSVDCPTLQLSCPKFNIPCDTDDVSVDIKVGPGERMRYCRDNPPQLVMGEYIWVFLNENLGHPAVDIDCSISCATN